MFSIILCGCVATLLLPSVVPSSLLLNHLPELEHLSIQLNQLLRSRSPLGLEAIDDVALMDRFDSKYVVPQAWLKNLVEILEEHAVLTIQNQVSTLYNNLYFDTPNGQCLEDHTRGKTVRYKVRIRHYENTGIAFLEVKLRDVHSKTVKHRIGRVSNCTWDSPLTEMEKQFLAKYIPFARDLTPTLQSSFERFTLIHVNQGERITFDQKLQFKAPTLSGGAASDWINPVRSLAVVEWKQRSINHQGKLIQAIRAQEGRRGLLGRNIRLSKFVLGHAHVYPDRNLKNYRSAIRHVIRAEHYASNPNFAPQSILR